MAIAKKKKGVAPKTIILSEDEYARFLVLTTTSVAPVVPELTMQEKVLACMKNPDLNRGVISSATSFSFLFCGGKGISLNNTLSVSGKSEVFQAGKKYDIDLLSLDMLPKSIAKILAYAVERYGNKYPPCAGGGYGGLQIGLNQNSNPSWNNVLSYQDKTLFFTQSVILPKSIAKILEIASSFDKPFNRKGKTWCGWSYGYAPDLDTAKTIIDTVLA